MRQRNAGGSDVDFFRKSFIRKPGSVLHNAECAHSVPVNYAGTFPEHILLNILKAGAMP